jgi:hypothetical protein
MDRWELIYEKPYPVIKIYSQVPAHSEYGIRVSKTGCCTAGVGSSPAPAKRGFPGFSR